VLPDMIYPNRGQPTLMGEAVDPELSGRQKVQLKIAWFFFMVCPLSLFTADIRGLQVHWKLGWYELTRMGKTNADQHRMT